MTDDRTVGRATGSGAGQPSRIGRGLILAVISAAAFSLSGPLAKGLFEAGWSTGGVLLVRTGLGAILLTPFALVALRHNWRIVRRNLRLVLAYAVFAVGGAQFAYLSAVQHMQVGPALLIEYTAPAAVVAWMWLRHGQRPSRLTVAGAVLAAVGLVLVLDLISGADLDTRGVLWALVAMVGCASYFVINADDSTGLPPIALGWLGLLLGTVLFGVLALAGLIPFTAATAVAHYGGMTVPWWLPVILLGAVTSAVAYGTGVAAARRLGSRLASFVALLEVVSGVVFAWLLLGEMPRAVQVGGGLLILGGLVVVKLGETPRYAAAPGHVAGSRPSPDQA
jgi:drug/metabolite transporter (DMT)-like permease